ncbi:hypothetical protein C7444_10440 [Sphaerotilus hippei]|uniref:Uncharacterized protein n=1 Tax=Sphaerotilus hippei TaxID=744406 RepID=A0A318H271_9BURK|nr:hypothetical protein [Sphaerotilus hippei]PXW97439.1 hypothetical protein C7444_10440 [Sphaerotilus hippei]
MSILPSNHRPQDESAPRSGWKTAGFVALVFVLTWLLAAPALLGLIEWLEAWIA